MMTPHLSFERTDFESRAISPLFRVGSRPCQNSNARRARRNILKKLCVMRTDNAADIRLDAMLENCIFYISPMYEFSHSLGQKRPHGDVRAESASPQTADIGGLGWQV